MKPYLKPYLREFVPTAFEDIPDATAYEAGYLVIDAQKCVGCLNCYLYCPDGVIYREGNKVAIDYDFCKGCGICRKICKIGAIEMEAEK